jgi:iron(III) transport system substrate-binding protein
MILNRFYITGLLIILALVIPAYAQNGVLNLYSSRHYQTDEALYNNFIKQSGIRLNRIEAGEDPLIERLRNEGAASPADVLVTVDAGRLWRAKQMGQFQPIDSKLLKARIPAHWSHPQTSGSAFQPEPGSSCTTRPCSTPTA